MTHYLQGYVRARQTLAQIEHRRNVTDVDPDQPDVRELSRWLGHVVTTLRRTLSRRPAPAARGRLSGA